MLAEHRVQARLSARLAGKGWEGRPEVWASPGRGLRADIVQVSSHWATGFLAVDGLFPGPGLRVRRSGQSASLLDSWLSGSVAGTVLPSGPASDQRTACCAHQVGVNWQLAVPGAGGGAPRAGEGPLSAPRGPHPTRGRSKDSHHPHLPGPSGLGGSGQADRKALPAQTT